MPNIGADCDNKLACCNISVVIKLLTYLTFINMKIKISTKN